MSLPPPGFMAMARLVAQATGSHASPLSLGPADWAELPALCRQHRVASLVLPVAKDWPDMPAEVLEGIRGTARANGLTALAHMAALATLDRAFAAAGIRYLVLKGIPLSCLLHGDPVRRGCGDIDLLVSPADFPAAVALLHNQGYALVDGMPPLTGDPGQDALIRDLGLRRDGILVELHQRLTGNSRRLPLSFDELHAGRQVVTVAGRAIPLPGPAHLGLYLLVHGISHGWERLGWLADLAMLCRDPAGADLLYRQAVAQGIDRAAGQTFALLRELLDCPLPDMPVPAKASWLTLRLAQGLAGQRHDRAWVLHNLGKRWQAWRLRRGMAALRHEMAYELRNPADRAYFRLPAGLSWLYPVLRPLGFIWRNFMRRRDQG